MSTQAQVAATQAQAIKSQANLEVGSRVQQNASTMASRLRDFKMMNSIMFFGSMVNKYLRDFLDKVYRILCPMRVSSNDKAEQASYQLKDVAQTLYTQKILGI